MNQIHVSVTQADIDVSSKGATVNALATALKRMRDAGEIVPYTGAFDCPNISCTTQVYNGYDPTNLDTLITECNCAVCDSSYAADQPTSVKVALQNIGDIKPEPFTTTITLRS